MQQNQIAEISTVKHPGYWKTVGEDYFFFLFVTWSFKHLTLFIELKKSCSIAILISHICNKRYIAHETDVND